MSKIFKLLICFILLFIGCRKDNPPYKVLHKGEKCKIDPNVFANESIKPVGLLIIDSLYKQNDYNSYFWVTIDEVGKQWILINDDLYDCK
jgi:hypothetical protein